MRPSPLPGRVGEPRLADPALDRVGDQLLVALEPVAAAEDQRDVLAVLVDHVRIDAREGADAAGRGPGAGRAAAADGDALAALDQRPDFQARDHHGLHDAHRPTPSLRCRRSRPAVGCPCPRYRSGGLFAARRRKPPSRRSPPRSSPSRGGRGGRGATSIASPVTWSTARMLSLILPRSSIASTLTLTMSPSLTTSVTLPTRSLLSSEMWQSPSCCPGG